MRLKARAGADLTRFIENIIYQSNKFIDENFAACFPLQAGRLKMIVRLSRHRCLLPKLRAHAGLTSNQFVFVLILDFGLISIVGERKDFKLML